MEEKSGILKVLRDAGQIILQDRHGHLEPISGQGIQRSTRFRFVENGKTLTCVIKVAAGDNVHRIHFPRSGEEWSTLKDVDRVLYLRRLPSHPDQYEAQMYSQKVLLDAFDKNHKHSVKVGIAHLPVWLSPDFEDGDRFVGSGFGDKALWKSTGPLGIRNYNKQAGRSKVKRRSAANHSAGKRRPCCGPWYCTRGNRNHYSDLSARTLAPSPDRLKATGASRWLRIIIGTTKG